MASLNQAGIDASAPPAGGAHAVEFGASLREIRLAHQRELADVSADLRIRQVFLQAIEEGRFEDLPGPTYAVGFVRAYADYLGLEVEEVLNRFKEMGGGVAPQTSLVPPSIVAEGRLPTGSVLLVAAVLAAAAYGGWYYLSLEGQGVDEGIAALPQRIAALVGMGTEPQVPAVPPVSDEKPATGGDAVAPAESAPAQEAPPTAEPVAEQTATEPAATDQAATEPAAPEQATEPAEPAETVAVAAETPPASRPSDSAAASPAPPPAPAAAETPTAAAPPVPARSAATESAAPPPARVRVVAASSEPQTAERPAPDTASQTPAAAPPEAPAAATQRQEAAAGAAPSPGNDTPAARQVAVTAAAAPRVMLRASASVWVEVREGNAEPMLSRLMHSGETFEVPARPGMVLTTGNAGGIEILIDGRTLPPLGPTGAVRSNVALDAASLLKQTGGAR